MKTYLKEWMESMGETPETLSEKTKLSSKMIQKWIDGTTTPSLEAMSIISKTIGVSVDTLIYSNGPQKEEIYMAPTFTTSDLSEAVRFQNFCKDKEIECGLMVDVKNEIFIVVYQSDAPIDIKEIAKIVKKRKYRDSRETAKDDARFENMQKIN